MAAMPGIPIRRAQQWQAAFAELNLLPPKVKYANEHPGSGLGTDKEKALFLDAGLPVPGEDPLEPWLFSWAVGEKQPAVQLKRLYAGDFDEVQNAMSNPGAVPALSVRRKLTTFDAAIATRTRLILAKGVKRKAFSRAAPEVAVIAYRDIHAYTSGAASLLLRSNVGPVIQIEWRKPGSSFMQFAFAMGAGWGDYENRTVSALAAESHGRKLVEQRTAFHDAMTGLAEDMQTVARAFPAPS